MSLPLPKHLPKNDSVSQSISALGQYVTVARDNSRAVGLQLTGTWTGTIQFFCLIDQGWIACPLIPIGGGTPVTQVTGNGTWIGSFAPVGSAFMVKASAWTSGTMTVTANCA